MIDDVSNIMLESQCVTTEQYDHYKDLAAHGGKSGKSTFQIETASNKKSTAAKMETSFATPTVGSSSSLLMVMMIALFLALV